MSMQTIDVGDWGTMNKAERVTAINAPDTSAIIDPASGTVVHLVGGGNAYIAVPSGTTVASIVNPGTKATAPAKPKAPAKPEEYKVEIANELIEIDPEVNGRLHAAGFTPAQAQLVDDLAGERLLPAVERIAGDESQTRLRGEHR